MVDPEATMNPKQLRAHKIRIISLDDLMVECEGCNYYHCRTGAGSRAEALRQWRKAHRGRNVK